MQVEITFRAEFWLSLFRRDVDVLIKLSEHHYDGECRRVGKPGGFLYGWFNITRDQSPCGDYKIEDVPKCSGSRRDLDTVLKICEGVRLAVRAKILTTEDAERIDRLCAGILTAMERATQGQHDYGSVLIQEPSERGRLMWATAPGKW